MLADLRWDGDEAGAALCAVRFWREEQRPVERGLEPQREVVGALVDRVLLQPHKLDRGERDQLVRVFHQLTMRIRAHDHTAPVEDWSHRLLASDLRLVVEHLLIAVDGRDAVLPVAPLEGGPGVALVQGR